MCLKLRRVTKWDALVLATLRYRKSAFEFLRFRHPIFALYVCALIINEFDTEAKENGKKNPRLQISLCKCAVRKTWKTAIYRC